MQMLLWLGTPLYHAEIVEYRREGYATVVKVMYLSASNCIANEVITTDFYAHSLSIKVEA